MAITVLPALATDVPIILSFIRALAEFEKLSHQVTATEQSLRDTLFGERRFAEAVVARVDGTPAGYALFFHNYSTFRAQPGIYLEDLFVLPEFRKQGVGKALLVEVAKIAHQRGCGRFEWTVLDWNTTAIDFYKRIGADVLSDWRVCRVNEQGIAKLANESM